MCCAVVKKKNLIFLCDWIFVSFGSFGLQFAFLDCPQQMLQESERIFFKKNLSLAVLPGCPWLSSGEDKFFIVKSQVSGILSIFGVLVRKLHIWIDHNMLYKNLKEFYKNVEV